jgi:predicted TPR repeat methyltransferase
MQDMQSDQPRVEDHEIILEPSPEVTSEIYAEIDRARILVHDGKFEEATEICKTLLARDELSIAAAAKLTFILRMLGQDEVADQIQSRILSEIRGKTHLFKNPQAAMFPAAMALIDFGEAKEAEKLIWKALEAEPDTQIVVVEAAALLVQLDRRDAAYQVAKEYLERAAAAFDAAIHFSVVFSHIKYPEAARMCLEIAKKNCKTKPQRAKLDYFLASNGVPVAELDQHSMVVELFDKFADVYDQQLGALGNNGPSLIYTALEELNLSKTQSRRVLDAGCGTGLCAGFLRDYAKELTGVDLSIKMLEVSRDKGTYDFLARTDLSVAATYPEGKFDLVVCADVFVYFGDLRTVLGNLQKALNPGGLLIATVEDENDDAVTTGFKLYPSGRYKHSDVYMQQTLQAVGFSKPRLMKHARLRNEFGLPVLGTVFAVQKPALVFN